MLFITSDDKVFGFGSNCFGCCGLGHNSVVYEPQIIPELCHKNIKQFFIGYDFILAQNFDNYLFGWGKNDHGQLARGHLSEETNFFTPEILCSKRFYIEIKCGLSHCLALTKDGMVYGWGDNRFGQIGCGHEKGDNISKAVRLEKFIEFSIIHIYCSHRKSFALTQNGWVYSWGYNEWCSLGHELDRNECVFEPRIITTLYEISSVSASFRNSYFLNDKGETYFCGYFEDENNREIFQKAPKRIHSKLCISNIISIPINRQICNFTTCSSLNDLYNINLNVIEKVEYKSLLKYYFHRFQITHNTVCLTDEKRGVISPSPFLNGN